MTVLWEDRKGLLLESHRYRDIKDPCPVFDGEKWHIYGSGGDSTKEIWNICHATAKSINGPWQEQESAKLALEGKHVAAPGVIYDIQEKVFHMFVQTDFLALNSKIYHLISSDGQRFNNFGVVLESVFGTSQACIYDPHPAIINGKKYITYAGTKNIGQPDIYLAKSISNSWYGPWKKMGKILSQEEVGHHNQLGDPFYEWGLEGPQLVELPNGKVLLNAVCFLPNLERGNRQRVFFALADKVIGPYKSLGVVLDPKEDIFKKGENGHAAGIVLGNNLELFYQVRAGEGQPWKYAQAKIDLSHLAI